jgi:PAS domain-containing protein
MPTAPGTGDGPHRPIRDSQGDVELVVEIGADIGEVRRLQERLQATQQRYQQLFDEAPCYITVQTPT